MPKERNYSVDLLRIVAMLMIVVLHFLGHGHVTSTYVPYSKHYALAWIVESVCLVAVNCYVLISGYFLISSRFNLEKFIRLVAQVVFYSLGIYIILLTTGAIQFTPLDTIRALLPNLTGVWWFISIYMAMYALSPFLNKIILSLDQKTHLSLVVLLVAIFSAWPTIFIINNSLSLISINRGYSLAWFIVLYFIASYLGRYYKPNYKINRHLLRYALVAVVSAVLLLGSDYLGAKLSISHLSTFSIKLHAYNSLTVLFSSIALFLVFLNLRIKNSHVNKAIATMAPLTFGVYLISDNPHIRKLLWDFVDNPAHAFSPYFIFYATGVILTIYLGCSLIDWGRLQLFNRLGRLRIINKIGDKITAGLSGVFQRAMRTAESLIK